MEQNLPLDELSTVIGRVKGCVRTSTGRGHSLPDQVCALLAHRLWVLAAPSEDERLTAFARKAYALMQPFSEHGEYVNFLGELGHHDAEAARRAYGQDKYRRLVALKDLYDPQNLFRHNHNIPPTGG